MNGIVAVVTGPELGVGISVTVSVPSNKVRVVTCPHRLSKRQPQSTTTVLFRTTFTRTIKLNLLLK